MLVKSVIPSLDLLKHFEIFKDKDLHRSNRIKNSLRYEFRLNSDV